VRTSDELASSIEQILSPGDDLPSSAIVTRSSVFEALRALPIDKYSIEDEYWRRFQWRLNAPCNHQHKR